MQCQTTVEAKLKCVGCILLDFLVWFKHGRPGSADSSESSPALEYCN